MGSLAVNIIQEAKAGQIEACRSILKALHDLWNLTHVETAMSDQGEQSEAEQPDAVELTHDEVPVETAIVPNAIEDYLPAERTLRPMVRWLLRKTLELTPSDRHAHSKLQEMLLKCSDKVIVTEIGDCKHTTKHY